MCSVDLRCRGFSKDTKQKSLDPHVLRFEARGPGAESGEGGSGVDVLDAVGFVDANHRKVVVDVVVIFAGIARIVGPALRDGTVDDRNLDLDELDGCFGRLAERTVADERHDQNGFAAHGQDVGVVVVVEPDVLERLRPRLGGSLRRLIDDGIRGAGGQGEEGQDDTESHGNRSPWGLIQSVEERNRCVYLRISIRTGSASFSPSAPSSPST